MNNLEILLDVKELGRYQRKVMTPLDEAFDPDAIDGDGDGLVQDRTPFERPAIITAITETAQRISQGIRDASRVNQKRSHTVHRERLRGKSHSEIAEALVPNDYASLASSLTEMAIQDLGVDASPAAIQTWIQGKVFDLTGDATGDVFDFTPKHIRKLRKTIEKHLDELPMFRRLVDDYGMPPFFILKKGNFSGITSHGFGIGVTTGGMGWMDGRGNRIPLIRSVSLKLGYFDKSGGSNKTKRWLTDTGIRGTVLHEYGHHLAGLLYDDIVTSKYGQWKGSPDVVDFARYINMDSFSISNENRFPNVDGKAGKSIPDVFSAMFQKPEWDEAWSKGDLPDELPHVLSFYSETNPSEQFAEGIAALLSTDPKQHKLVSPGFESMVKQLLELETDVPFHSQGSKYNTDVFDLDGDRMVLGSRGTDFTTPSGNRELWHPITKDMDVREMAERIHPSNSEELISIMAEENHRITPTSSIEDHEALVGQVLMELFDVKSIKELDSMMDLSQREEKVEAVEQLLLDNPSMMLLHNQYGAPPLIHLTPEAYDDAAKVMKGGFAGIHVKDPRLNIGTIFLSPDTTNLLENYNTPPLLEGESFQELLDNRPLGQRLVLSYAKWRGKYPKSVTYMTVGSNIEQLYAHEYGHYLHEQMASSLPMEGNRERRALLRAYLSETWEEFFAAVDRPDWAEAYTDRRKKDLPDDYPFVDSAYGFTNPLEMFAESFTAATASDPAIRGAVSPEMNRQMAMMLGLDPEQAIYEQLVANDEVVSVSLGISRPLGSQSGETKPVIDYNEARKAGRSKIFRKKYKSRAEMYDGASTEQQVRLSVPRTPEEHHTMMMDATVDRLNLQLKLKNAGISDEPVDVRRFIDMSDPLNPRARIDAVQPLVEHVSKTAKEYEPDFSPEAVKQAEAMVTQTLNSSPSLRHFASEYGLPPVVIGSQNALDRQMIVYALKISKPNQEMNSILDQYQGIRQMMEEARIQEILDDPAAMDKIRKAYDNGTNPIAGAYINAANMLVIYPGSSSHKAFLDGKPIDPAYVPKPGDHTVLDNSIEATLLHEYGHYFDQRVGMLLSEGGLDPESDMAKAYTRLHHSDTLDALTSKRGNPLFVSKDNPVIETTYGQTNTQEMVAEAMSAVFSHNPHAMEMLNKPLLDDVHTLLGIKSSERNGVTERDLPWLTDVKDKRSELASLTSGPLGSRPTREMRPPRPTLKKLKKDKRYKKLSDETVKLSGKDYTFSHESIASDTFVVKHNGTTVGILNVGEGLAGEPRVSSLTVHGNHKTSGLEQGLVEFAHGYYPSLRSSKRTSEAFAARQFPDAFEDLPDGHLIIELPDGVPGSPEYVTSLSEQMKRAKRDKTVAVFEYNNEIRRVTVDDVYEQNGQTYMKGFDSTRNDGRTFRVDRIFRPKTTNVVTEDGTKTAVAKKPKTPRKPVAPYTGKAEELFKGATSYREVHDRLTTGELYFFDFETTGIVSHPNGEMKSPGEPVQLGISKVVDGKVVDRYNVHMNPGTPLSQWSKDNLKRTDPDGTQHLLTDEWLATQPPIADQIKAAFDFVGGEGKTFGGQYQIFDQDVMKESLSPEEFARWERIAIGFIDSKGVVDHLFPRYDKDAPQDNRLGTMTKHFGVPLNNWHDASADAEASWAVIEAAVRRAAEREERGEPLQQGLRDITNTRAAHSDLMKKYDNQLTEFRQSVEQIKKETEQASKALGSRSPKEKITTGTSKLKYVGKNTGSNEFFNENTRVVQFGTSKNTRNYLLYNDRDTIYAFDYDKSGPLDGWDPKKMPKALYVGQMSTWNNPESVRNGEPKHEIFNIDVKKSHQRRGLATAMMTFYQEAFPERKLQHSDVLSEEGKAFRAATEAADIEDAAASALGNNGTVNAARIAGQEEVAKAGKEAAQSLASAGSQ